MPANAKHKIRHLWPLLELIAAVMDTSELHVGTTKASSGARLQIHVIAGKWKWNASIILYWCDNYCLRKVIIHRDNLEELQETASVQYSRLFMGGRISNSGCITRTSALRTIFLNMLERMKVGVTFLCRQCRVTGFNFQTNFFFPDPADMNYCQACCRERGCCESLTLYFCGKGRARNMKSVWTLKKEK